MHIKRLTDGDILNPTVRSLIGSRLLILYVLRGHRSKAHYEDLEGYAICDLSIDEISKLAKLGKQSTFDNLYFLNNCGLIRIVKLGHRNIYILGEVDGRKINYFELDENYIQDDGLDENDPIDNLMEFYNKECAKARINFQPAIQNNHRKLMTMLVDEFSYERTKEMISWAISNIASIDFTYMSINGLVIHKDKIAMLSSLREDEF